MAEYPTIDWTEKGEEYSARWRSESAVAPPKRVVIANDQMTADAAYRLASEGTAMLWRGDFQNAKQLLQALARRVDRKKTKPAATPIDAFNQHRQTQARRARTLGMLLLNFADDCHVDLRRAPDVRQACIEAYGPALGPFVTSLRELLGIVGAHEWRKKGIDIPAVGGRIHPHYGVFAPIRAEYVQLVNDAPLPSTTLAFDIGTGTGVLAAVLARRGVQKNYRDRSRPTRIELCTRKYPATRLCRTSRNRKRRFISSGTRTADCLQSAVDSRATQFAARTRGIRFR